MLTLKGMTKTGESQSIEELRDFAATTFQGLLCQRMNDLSVEIMYDPDSDPDPAFLPKLLPSEDMIPEITEFAEKENINQDVTHYRVGTMDDPNRFAKLVDSGALVSEIAKFAAESHQVFDNKIRKKYGEIDNDVYCKMLTRNLLSDLETATFIFSVPADMKIDGLPEKLDRRAFSYLFTLCFLFLDFTYTVPLLRYGEEEVTKYFATTNWYIPKDIDAFLLRLYYSPDYFSWNEQVTTMLDHSAVRNLVAFHQKKTEDVEADIREHYHLLEKVYSYIVQISKGLSFSYAAMIEGINLVFERVYASEEYKKKKKEEVPNLMERSLTIGERREYKDPLSEHKASYTFKSFRMEMTERVRITTRKISENKDRYKNEDPYKNSAKLIGFREGFKIISDYLNASSGFLPNDPSYILFADTRNVENAVEEYGRAFSNYESHDGEDKTKQLKEAKDKLLFMLSFLYVDMELVVPMLLYHPADFYAHGQWLYQEDERKIFDYYTAHNPCEIRQVKALHAIAEGVSYKRKTPISRTDYYKLADRVIEYIVEVSDKLGFIHTNIIEAINTVLASYYKNRELYIKKSDVIEGEAKEIEETKAIEEKKEETTMDVPAKTVFGEPENTEEVTENVEESVETTEGGETTMETNENKVNETEFTDQMQVHKMIDIYTLARVVTIVQQDETLFKFLVDYSTLAPKVQKKVMNAFDTIIHLVTDEN